MSENQYVTDKMTECKSFIENNKTATVCIGITGLALLCTVIKSKGTKRHSVSSNNERHFTPKNHDKKGLKDKIFMD